MHSDEVPITAKLCLSVKEASAYSGFPASYIYGLVRSGEWPVFQTGRQGGWYILRTAIEDWVNEHCQKEVPSR